MARIKTLILAAMSFVLAATNINAQAYDIIEEMIQQGSLCIMQADEHKLEYQPRHEEIQLFAVSEVGDTLWGPMKSVYKDGSSIAITLGVGRFAERHPNVFNGTEPMIGLSYQRDGILGWYKKDGTAVRPFAFEANVSVMPRRFEKTADTPKKSYLSYKTTLYGKYRLYEDKWLRNRINAVGAVGYLFSKDNESIEKEDVTFSPYYTGSGLTAGIGLEWRYQPALKVKLKGDDVMEAFAKAKGNRTANDGISARLMIEMVPRVQYANHSNQLFVSITLSYSFGINRWIAR